MATDVLPTPAAADSDWDSVSAILKKLIEPLASLKLTVALFAMAIFVVFAGTLAQVEKDVWQVVDEYFRTWFTWMEFQIFFPPSFFVGGAPKVPGGIWFPGGWLIGLLMFVNLIAAHSVRFTIQARGTRLAAGLGVIGLGVLVTGFVIASGSTGEGLQGTPILSWSALWILFQVMLGAGCLAAVAGLVKLDRSRTVERWSLGLLAAVLGTAVVWLLVQGDAARLSDSSLRILWQLMKATGAGLVLLAGSLLVFKKRAGIVVLHAGIGLMMLNELWVGVSAVEAQMPVDEGQTVNFVQDIRELELAVIDKSDPEVDRVVVVPDKLLKNRPSISHDELPFDIEIVEYFQNTSPRKLKPGETSPATSGSGTVWTVEKVRPGTGTDTGGQVDMSAAYLTFKQDGKVLGTYLTSLFMAAQDIPERVTVDGKTYDVFLRFKRIYKPYSVTLLDVRKDDYLGTNTPKNYSSDIRLFDPTRNVDREVHIWMNNPLRYAGETFYQSGYHMDPSTGQESTTLQVVTNAGWMIPYVACMIVATGLLAHFGIVLFRFLGRRSREGSAAATQAHRLQPAGFGGGFAAWAIPLTVLLVFGGWVGSKARPPKMPITEMQIHRFGELPLVYEGRVKPMDSLARNSLQVLSGRQEYVDAQDRKQPAIRWLLDVIADQETAFEHKIFRIENTELLDTLGLEPRSGLRYGFAEFGEKLPELTRQAELARSVPAEDRSVYQRKVLELERKIGVLDLLMQSFNPPRIRPDHVREDLLEAIRRQQRLAERHPPLVIPPPEDAETPAGGGEPTWETFSTAWTKDIVRIYIGQEQHPATKAMTEILLAYGQKETNAFNRAVADYQQLLKKQTPSELDLGKTRFEWFFNHFAPFYHASALYVIAFVLTAVGWLLIPAGWGPTVNRAAFWLVLLTFAIHTFALIARMYISGRPPVTNLYSSAVFIGWGAVLLGIIFELLYRFGIGNAVASMAGFATLVIAHFLSVDGDTFTVMQAVLDTQFWLATHVVCISLGYTTTYVAGILGLVYVIGGVLTPFLSPKIGRELTRMTYGTLCFAIFFSFVGTVLGGLWADDSWGRFWGWDPKENGALIIVLWNALVLHARWAGLVKERGLAVLAIGGNIAVSWSWFGVNELGVGLHSYGFTDGVLRTLGLFCASQLVMIGIGLLPKDLWWSHLRRRQPEALT